MSDDGLAALLEPNDAEAPDDQPIGFRGAFIAIEPHNGHVWVMIGEQPFARVFDTSLIPAFWVAYNQGLAVAREVGRQGI